MSDHKQMLRNSQVMAVMTAVSRVFGLAREVLIASLLGTSRYADVWNMAFMVPNLFRRFLAEGAMTSALVPLLSEAHAAGDERQEREFARAFFTLILIAATIVSAVMIMSMPVVLPALIDFMSPGQTPTASNQSDAVLPTQIMFPYLVFVSLAAVCQGILNVRNRFALPAATPIFLNMAIIGLGYGLRNHFGSPIWGLCVGVLLGGFLQFMLQWIQLTRLRFWLWPTLRVWTKRTKEALKLWFPITLAAGIYQVNVLVSQTIAFNLFHGAMAALNYSNRLMELVLGVFATAISTSILPLMSKQKLDPDPSQMRKSLWRGLEALTLVTMPATLGMMLCGYTLISLLFQRGRFDVDSLNLVYGALLVQCVALVPISWYRVVSQAFFAFKHVRLSLALSAFASTINICLCLWLPSLFDPAYAHLGIALATVIYSWILILVAVRLVKNRYALAPEKGFMLELVKITLASTAFVPIWMPFRLEVLPLSTWLFKVGASAIVFVVCCWLMKVRSLESLFERIMKR